MQKIVPFRIRMHFLPFSGQKTQKILPGRVFVVEFRSFWPWCARVGPHTRSQKLGAIRQTGQVLAVEGGGFGMTGGDPRSHLSASHPPNVPNFFHVLLCPSRARTQKIVPFRVRMDFSTIFRAENPENTSRT